MVNFYKCNTFVLYRVFSQHLRGSDGHQSNPAHGSDALAAPAANHTARSCTDQQQQQQERHVHGRSSQTGGWLDKGDCCSSQSVPPLPQPDQIAETPTELGKQGAVTHRSIFTWGIWTGGVHTGVNNRSYFGFWFYQYLNNCHNCFLFQMKSHFGPSNFQLPLSCPMSAALNPRTATNAAPSSSAMLPPGYLFSTGSYSRMVTGPLYPQQWPSMPSPTGSLGPVGLLGAGRAMPFAAMANPRLKSYPLVLCDTENGPCPKNTRTT